MISLEKNSARLTVLITMFRTADNFLALQSLAFLAEKSSFKIYYEMSLRAPEVLTPKRRREDSHAPMISLFSIAICSTATKS